MSQDETRAATMALGNKMFGGLRDKTRPTSPSYRRTPAPSVRDVLAANKKTKLFSDTSGRAVAGPQQQATPFANRGNIQTQEGRPLGDIIDKGNAINTKANQQFFGRDNMFDAGPQAAQPEDPYASDYLGQGNTPKSGAFWSDQVAPVLKQIGKDFNSDANPLNRPMSEWSMPDFSNKVPNNAPTVGLGPNGAFGVDQASPVASPTAEDKPLVDLGVPSHIGPQQENSVAPVQDPNKAYLQDGKGWMSKVGENNVGGISNQEVLSRLIARTSMDGVQRNPYAPQQEETGQGGMDAKDVGRYLTTPQDTGRVNKYGQSIKETPKSVKLNSALDFNYNRDSKRAAKYDKNLAIGMTPQEAMADVENSARSFKDREMRLKEQAQRDTNAVSMRNADLEKEQVDINKFNAEKSAWFQGEQATLFPAQKAFYEAQATELKGRGEASVKAERYKAFTKAQQEIMTSSLDEEQKNTMLYDLTRSYQGFMKELVSKGSERVDSTFGFGGKPAVDPVYKYVKY